MGEAAVVLLSGGLDSATVLAMAARRGRHCHTLSLDYGQRHRVELEAAEKLSRALGAAEHRCLRLDFSAIARSALTDENIAVPESPGEGIPATYVPARNTVFLSLALAWAETLGAGEIYAGVNAVDYSGYPDCRPEYLAAFGKLAALATRAGVEGSPPKIIAPLIRMGKAEIIQTGLSLGVDYALTVSCYQARRLGSGCGVCDSCRLRRAAFEEIGKEDPLSYSA